MKERGVSVHPTTIMCWVHEYGHQISKNNKSAHHAWRLDETYIKVKGEWRYLYRTIDQEGYTLDILLRKTRYHQTAYTFIDACDILYFIYYSYIVKNVATGEKFRVDKNDFKQYKKNSRRKKSGKYPI